MTKLIILLVALVVGFIGYHLFEYWRTVDNEGDKVKAPVHAVTGEELPGVPYQLQQSLQKAQGLGFAGLRDWLKAYGSGIQDPRKAWIQLDYCLLVTREDISEAKRVFADVKARTSKSSPVWPRIQQLEKTYE
jgi:hypothetical protein